MAGAVYYRVPVHTKFVKAVVVYPLVVQNHFLVVRLACRVNAESEPAGGLMSIRLAKLKWPRAHRYRLGFSLISAAVFALDRQACKRHVLAVK